MWLTRTVSKKVARRFELAALLQNFSQQPARIGIQRIANRQLIARHTEESLGIRGVAEFVIAIPLPVIHLRQRCGIGREFKRLIEQHAGIGEFSGVDEQLRPLAQRPRSLAR